MTAADPENPSIVSAGPPTTDTQIDGPPVNGRPTRSRRSSTPATRTLSRRHITRQADAAEYFGLPRDCTVIVPRRWTDIPSSPASTIRERSWSGPRTRRRIRSTPTSCTRASRGRSWFGCPARVTPWIGRQPTASSTRSRHCSSDG